MYKKIISKQLVIALIGSAAVSLMTEVSAHSEYVEPTGAEGCASCHLDSEGNGFKPGVLEASKSPLGLIEGLKAFLKPAVTDTKPVLHPINSKWDVTVGEMPLVIPLQVTDKEDDTFALHGSVPTGYTTSKVYIKNNLPTIDFIWSPKAAQANKVYPIKVFVQETGAGRTLSSNTVTTNIKVWPARTTKTRDVSQFMLQGAQWKNNALSLNGQLAFKSSLTAAQRTAALASLTMSITSIGGVVINKPMKLSLGTNGSWSKTLPLSGSQVPCIVKLSYEGFRAARPVSLAPTTTCVK